MFIKKVVPVVLFLLGNCSSIPVKGQTCVLDDQDKFSRPCGYCGVCKTTLKSQNEGICDNHYLELSGLFVDTRSSRCELKNYCENIVNLCQNDSLRFTGVCFPLFGTYRCECKNGFFGKNCEYQDVGFKLTCETSNCDEQTMNHLAEVHNVVFTPIFYRLDFATILIALQSKGRDLLVSLNNGREKLYYTELKCETTFNTQHFCKDLFYEDEVNNIRICEGLYLQKRSEPRNQGCLMTLKVPFPRSYDKSRVIHRYFDEERSANNPVLGNLETITVGIMNGLGQFVNYKVFDYSFKLINIHETPHPRSHCAPKARLVNCGASMDDMPTISQYTDIGILQSVTTKKPDSTCQGYGKFLSSWKVWRIQVNHDELNDKPLIHLVDTNSFVPNEKKLDYGVYKVQLTVVNNLLDYVVPEKTYCYFKVIRTPVQTTILGGSMRMFYFKKLITLEVSSSEVPDRHHVSQGITVGYNWHCNDLHEKFCKPFATSDSMRKIRGPFQVSKTYTFTVDTKTIHKFGTVTEHPETQAVKVTSSIVLNLAMFCLKNCGGSVIKSNPQEVILLEVTSDGLPHDKNLTLYWKYKCLTDDINFRDVNIIKDRDSSQFKLLIKRNQLKEGRKYVFLVAADDSVSLAEIIIETDQSPKEIACEVFPNNGTKGETMFSIRCKSQVKEDGLPSLMYEFCDRYSYEKNIMGRIVGYSTTGAIENIMLTRDRLFVRATNFFGTATEILVNVKLVPPVKTFSPSSIRQSRDKFKNKDYIYRMGLISAYSDLIGSRFFWSDEIQILLDLLIEEEAQPQDIMGALLLKNSLSITACDKLIAFASETTIFQCESMSSIAKIMYQVTHRLQKRLYSNTTNSRILTSLRTKVIVDSMLECSDFVLNSNYLSQHMQKDVQIHQCLKKSTYLIVDTLDDLVYIVALQMPLIKRQKFKAGNIALFVEELKSHTNNSVIRTSDVIQEDFNYYIQQIIFNRNPFWWGSGSKINTNVYSFHLNSRNEHIYNPSVGRTVDFHLKIDEFRPISVQGSVQQPDPTKNSDVKDLEVTVYRLDPETYSETFIEFVNVTEETKIKVLILKSERPDFDLMTTKATEVTQFSRKWSFGMKGKRHTTFYYIGILPGPEVSVGASVNYTFLLFGARCAVYKYRSWISGEKCVVNKSSDINNQLLSCSCSLLTITIGGYVYSPTISLNPFSDFLLFLEISENTLTVSLLLINFLVFSIILIWTRKKDREDAKTKNVIVLEYDRLNDTNVYLITVFTGLRLGGGTTSNVGIKLLGETATSRTHVLSSSQQPILQCGGDDWFLLSTPQNLGSIIQIKLWIDYSGSHPNWFCRKVIVYDLKSSKTHTFLVEKWFGISMNGVRLEFVTKAAASREAHKLRLVFYHNLIQGFRELHMFVSIFVKHPRSLVTRTQRLSVALCCILVAMLTTTLLYSLSTPIFEDFAFYKIKIETFVISFISSFSATVVGLVSMHLFRKSYNIVGYNKCLSQSEISLNNQKLYESYKKNKSFCLKLLYKYTEKYVSSCKILPIGNIGITKDAKQNNSQRNLAWMICLITTFVSVYVVIMASLPYGKSKRLLWFTSLIFTGLIGFFILIPIKVFLTAVFLSLLKIHYFDLLSHNITMNKFLQYIRRNKLMTFDGDYKTACAAFFHSFNRENHFHKRVERAQYKGIRILISAYILETLVLIGVIVWAMQEFETYKHFYSNTAICNEILSVEVCDKVYDVDLVFMILRFHVHEYTLPKLYTKRWYNGDAVSEKEDLYKETGWLKDANSRLIGDPHLLQVRVQKNLCYVPRIMMNFSSICLPPLSSQTVDRDNYSLSWTHDEWAEIGLFSESPWEFVKGSGIGVRTPSDYYLREGGYVASLLRTLSAAELVYTNLIDTGWINDQTRIIVLEFVSYNVNNNVITSSYFVTETFPTNIIKVSYTIRSKSHYYKQISVKSKLFVLFSLYFLIRTFVLINVMGVGNFFNSFWNCYDVFFSILYIVASVKLVYLLYLYGTEEKAEVMVKNRHVYLEVLFQARQNTILYICYTFGVAAVRLIRVAGINDSCKKYIRDVIETRTELLLTVLLSFSSMFIMFRLVMYYLEPPTVYDFMDILVFQSDFHSLQGLYDDFTGKLSAYILGRLSDITMFSFTVSLVHHQRQITLRRLSLIETS